MQRTVDVARDDEHGHRQGDKRLLGGVESGVGQTVRIEKIRRKLEINQNNSDQEEQQQDFPTQQVLSEAGRRLVRYDAGRLAIEGARSHALLSLVGGRGAEDATP